MELLELSWPAVKALGRRHPGRLPDRRAGAARPPHAGLHRQPAARRGRPRGVKPARRPRPVRPAATGSATRTTTSISPARCPPSPRTYLDLLTRHGRELHPPRLPADRASSTATAATSCRPSRRSFEVRQKYRERNDLLLLSVTYWTAGGEPPEADPGLEAGPHGPRLRVGDVDDACGSPRTWSRRPEERRRTCRSARRSSRPTGPGSCPTGACPATSAIRETRPPRRARGCSVVRRRRVAALLDRVVAWDGREWDV